MGDAVKPKPMMFVDPRTISMLDRADVRLTAEQVVALDHLIEALDVAGQPIAVYHPSRIVRWDDYGSSGGTARQGTVTLLLHPRDEGPDKGSSSVHGSMWVEWHDDRWRAFHDQSPNNRLAYEGPVVQP